MRYTEEMMLQSKSGFCMPFEERGKDVELTLGYGKQKHPVTGTVFFHHGLDFEANHYLLSALASGTVSGIGNDAHHCQCPIPFRLPRQTADSDLPQSPVRDGRTRFLLQDASVCHSQVSVPHPCLAPQRACKSRFLIAASFLLYISCCCRFYVYRFMPPLRTVVSASFTFLP